MIVFVYIYIYIHTVCTGILRCLSIGVALGTYQMPYAAQFLPRSSEFAWHALMKAGATAFRRRKFSGDRCLDPITCKGLVRFVISRFSV